MKAAVVVSTGKLEIWDIPTPKPGPYDALCRIEYGATCAGTDIHLMDGLHPYPVRFPTILGHESVGCVVEVGTKVRNFHVGDLVTRVGAPANLVENLGANWGGFAQYGIARDHWQMRRDGLPRTEWDRFRVNQVLCPEIGEREAPMVITWRETLSYVNRIGIHDGASVLLIGSGANALSIAAHCCNLGATVICVGSPKKEAAFRTAGAADYISYHADELNQQVNLAREKLQIPPFEFLIDGVGGAGTVNTLLPLMRRNATLGVYGWNGRASYGINPFRAEGSLRLYADGYDEEETHAQVQSFILRGKLRAQDWYNPNTPVPLTDIAKAYDNLRRHEAFKFLISLQDE